VTKQTLLRDNGKELTFHCDCGKISVYPKPQTHSEEFVMHKIANSACLTCQGICETHQVKKEMININGERVCRWCNKNKNTLW
jgi:hypothetical protein